MKLVIKRRYFGYIWIFAAFLIPYIEIASVRNLLEIETENMVIPAVFPVMLLLWAYLWCTNRLSGYHRKSQINKYLHGMDIGLFFFVLITVFTAVLYDAQWHHLMQTCMILLPYLFARECLLRIKGYGISNVEIVKYGIAFFTILQMFFFAINVMLYGFSFGGETSNRIIAVGGGPVVLGYTVALVYATWLMFREKLPNRLYLCMTLCMLLVVLATGSRGGMWPFLLLLVIGYMCKRGKLSAKRSVITLIVALLALILVDFQKYFPRLFLFDDNSRMTILWENLDVYRTLSFWEQLIGKGLGMFYPYQLWLLDNSLACFHQYNRFTFEGASLLVQPHNTYVYVLFEAGIVGLSTLIFTFKRAAFGKRLKRRQTSLAYQMFVITFFFLLFVESTLFVEVGSAALWWFILMLVGSSDEKYID